MSGETAGVVLTLDETALAPDDGELADHDPRRNLLEAFSTPLKPGPSGSNVSPGQEHMKVYLRIRPFTEEEINTDQNQGCIQVDNDHSLLVHAPKDSHTFKNSVHGAGKQTHKFTFSKIFHEATSQDHFFGETILKTVKDFIDGQNCLIFTYGVTNSGKTYTIQGNAKDGGILPRSLDVVFNSIKNRQSDNMDLKPRMFCDVVKLSPRQEEAERKIKEKVLRMGTDDENEITVSSLVGEEDTSKSTVNSSTMSEDSLSQTNTLPGERPASLESGSLDKESMDKLFQEAEDRVREEAAVSVDSQGQIKFSVWVTFAEIYNEYIYDLLEPMPKKKNARRPTLILREDKNGVPYAKGLKAICVTSADEAYKVLTIGKQNLQMACTKLNQNSSRSHCIFTVKILRVVDKDNPHMARMSMLSFCDLAGSERYSKSGTTGDRIKEAGNINTSLLALGRCIKVLRHNQIARDHPQIVPFRDSKLTRLFQSFFCGKGKACMIVNINQCAKTFDETLHALKYSAVAKQVVVVQEPPKEKGKRVPARSHKLVSMAVAQTPGGKRTLRHTIDWATPGTMMQLMKLEEEAMNVPIPDDDDDEDITFIDDESEREMELLELIQQLKSELIQEKKKMMSLEMQVREEVCQEMQQQLVEIENTYSERLIKEQNQADEKVEKRVDMYIQSVKKSRKRKRFVEDDEEEYVPSIQLHAEQVKNQDLQKKIDDLELEAKDLKQYLQKNSEERDKLRKENSQFQFDLAELKSQMKKRSNPCSGESMQANREMLETYQIQLEQAKAEIERKELQVKEYQETLEDAGETFHQKEAEITELQKMVDNFEKRFQEQTESITDLEGVLQESRTALETANQRLQEKQTRVENLESELSGSKGNTSHCIPAKQPKLSDFVDVTDQHTSSRKLTNASAAYTSAVSLAYNKSRDSKSGFRPRHSSSSSGFSEMSSRVPETVLDTSREDGLSIQSDYPSHTTSRVPETLLDTSREDGLSMRSYYPLQSREAAILRNEYQPASPINLVIGSETTINAPSFMSYGSFTPLANSSVRDSIPRMVFQSPMDSVLIPACSKSKTSIMSSIGKKLTLSRFKKSPSKGSYNISKTDTLTQTVKKKPQNISQTRGGAQLRHTKTSLLRLGGSPKSKPSKFFGKKQQPSINSPSRKEKPVVKTLIGNSKLKPGNSPARKATAAKKEVNKHGLLEVVVKPRKSIGSVVARRRSSYMTRNKKVASKVR